MALSGKALDVCLNLYIRDFFKNINSVIDMGDQDLNLNFNDIETKFKKFNINFNKDLFEGAKKYPERPRVSSSAFWKSIGINVTDRMDIMEFPRSKNDNLGKFYKHDLNNPLDKKELIKKYDLVTDFGNNEHPFNIAETYKTMHKLCKKGGVLFIDQAYFGGNGFYNFDISYFENLAAVNDYSCIHSCLVFNFKDNYFSTPVDRDFIKHVNMENVQTISQIFVLRKNSDEDFRFPYQGKGKNIVSEEYYHLDYVGKNLPLEKIYLPNNINDISTKKLIKTLMQRFKNKIKK